ncbi:MAG: HAD hydrolase-like protein [Candidatus Nomurabacteria bacterium]|nr:HAD hydrolase-like protein [Candidatus Nomurabacteria bacterium]
MKKIVLFDFDGVLVDTLLIYYGISKQVNSDMSLEEYKTFFEGNIHDAIRQDGSMRKPHKDFHREFEPFIREIKIPQILKDILNNLAHKYTLIIVSSTPTNAIKQILKNERVENCFTDVLGADVHTSKIVKINSLLEEYKIEPKNVLFITDTLGDIREGEKCNVQSIAVSWGFHEKEVLEKGKPFAIIDNPIDLENKVDEFFVV